MITGISLTLAVLSFILSVSLGYVFWAIHQRILSDNKRTQELVQKLIDDNDGAIRAIVKETNLTINDLTVRIERVETIATAQSMNGFNVRGLK